MRAYATRSLNAFEVEVREHTILRHLGLPATPPPLSPARGPPQPDLGFDADLGLDFDQTPAYDLTDPEPVPDFDFDQSVGT